MDILFAVLIIAIYIGIGMLFAHWSREAGDGAMLIMILWPWFLFLAILYVIIIEIPDAIKRWIK